MSAVAAKTDRRFRRLNHPQYKTKSLLCSPLRVQGEVIGVFNVNNKISGAPFDEDDLSVLSALIDRVASAVERAVAERPLQIAIVPKAVQAVRQRLGIIYLCDRGDGPFDLKFCLPFAGLFMRAPPSVNRGAANRLAADFAR